MKKKIFLPLTLCFIFIMTFVFSACAGEAKIESINGNTTVYRYTIKQIDLIDNTSEQETILETTTQFKYCYCDKEYFLTNISLRESIISLYFDDITTLDYVTAYSTKYDKPVYMRVTLNERPKEYRPKLSTRNGLTKVTYYEISSYNNLSFSDINYYLIAKNEITYSSYLSAQKDYQKQLYELRNDTEAKEELETQFKKTYEHTAILTTTTEFYNLNTEDIHITCRPQ